MTFTTETVELLAIRSCAVSERHSGGDGHHDAERYGACSLHEQAAEDVLASGAVQLAGEVRAEAEARGQKAGRREQIRVSAESANTDYALAYGHGYNDGAQQVVEAVEGWIQRNHRPAFTDAGVLLWAEFAATNLRAAHNCNPESVRRGSTRSGGMIQTYPNICSSGVGGGEVCMRRKGHDGDHDPDSTEVRL